MEVLIDGNLGVSNILPTITIRLDKYDLAKLISEGKLVVTKRATSLESNQVDLYQETRIEVK